MKISFRYFRQLKKGVDGPSQDLITELVYRDAPTTEKLHIDTKLVTEIIVKPQQLCTRYKRIAVVI